MNHLLTHDLLATSSYTDTAYKPTPLAKPWIEKNQRHLPFNQFNGLKYFESGPIFIQRLLLLIQTLSNSKMRYFSFIPVIDKTDVTDWVKRTYKQMKRSEEHTSELQSRGHL